MSSILDQTQLNKLARAKDAADKAYHEAWVQARTATTRLPIDRFWAIMDVFRRSILSFHHHDVSKHAIDELFRRCVIEDLETGGQAITFDELVSFIENWSAVSAKLHEHLFEIVTDKGDDSYGDLTDSLPLIGRVGVKALLELQEGDDIDNNTVIFIIDNENPGKDPAKWREFIWHGENYFHMFLDDEAERRFVREACDHDPEESVEALV